MRRKKRRPPRPTATATESPSASPPPRSSRHTTPNATTNVEASGSHRLRLPAAGRHHRRDGRPAPSLSSIRAWSIATTVTAAVVYSWVAAALLPFTRPEEVMVAIPIVLAAAAAARGPSSGTRVTPEIVAPVPRRGTAIWLTLLAAIGLWELIALFSAPREDHPTLSSVADWIMSVHAGRAVMFLLWLTLGAVVAGGGLSEKIR